MIVLFYSIYTLHGCRHNFLGKLDKKLNACSPEKPCACTYLSVKSIFWNNVHRLENKSELNSSNLYLKMPAGPNSAWRFQNILTKSDISMKSQESLRKHWKYISGKGHRGGHFVRKLARNIMNYLESKIADNFQNVPPTMPFMWIVIILVINYV